MPLVVVVVVVVVAAAAAAAGASPQSASESVESEAASGGAAGGAAGGSPLAVPVAGGRGGALAAVGGGGASRSGHVPDVLSVDGTQPMVEGVVVAMVNMLSDDLRSRVVARAAWSVLPLRRKSRAAMLVGKSVGEQGESRLLFGKFRKRIETET